MNLLLLFFMFNWLPPVMQQAVPDQDRDHRHRAVQFGRRGRRPVLGWLADRHSPHKVLWITLWLRCDLRRLDRLFGILHPADHERDHGRRVLRRRRARASPMRSPATSYPTSMRATGIGWR